MLWAPGSYEKLQQQEQQKAQQPSQPKAPDMGAYQPRKTFWDYAQPPSPQTTAQQPQAKPGAYDAYNPGRAQPVQPPSQGTPYQPSAGGINPGASRAPGRNAFLAEYFNPNGGYRHDAEFDQRLAGGGPGRDEFFPRYEEALFAFSPDMSVSQRESAQRRLGSESYAFDNQQRPTRLSDYRYNGQSYAVSPSDPFSVDVQKLYDDYRGSPAGGAPGRAQPMQPPSQGTPYQPYATVDPVVTGWQMLPSVMRDESGQAQTMQLPSPTLAPGGDQGREPNDAIPYGPGYEGNWRGRREPDTTRTEPGYATSQRGNGPERRIQSDQDGNAAYRPYGQRPQPFVARYNNFDGTASDRPNYNLRDAFIQQANTAMMPYYSGRNQGRPQFNFQSLMSQARDMANNGWSNPFAPQQQSSMPSLADYLAQFAPPGLYQPPAPPTGGAVGPLMQ